MLLQRFSQSNLVRQTAFELIAGELLSMMPATPGMGTPDDSVHKGQNGCAPLSPCLADVPSLSIAKYVGFGNPRYCCSLASARRCHQTYLDACCMAVAYMQCQMLQGLLRLRAVCACRNGSTHDSVRAGQLLRFLRQARLLTAVLDVADLLPWPSRWQAAGVPRSGTSDELQCCRRCMCRGVGP